MEKKILQYKDHSEILRQKCLELSREEILSDEVQALILEMKKIMQNAPGVGLAAPQIGISLPLAVIEDPAERLKDIDQHILIDRQRGPVDFHVIINAKIINLNGKVNYFFEGCLSIKGSIRVIPRHETIHVKYWSENAEPKEIIANGWYARILQHEIDHLNGKLNIDIGDTRTEITSDEFKEKWSKSMSREIYQFYREKCIETNT